MEKRGQVSIFIVLGIIVLVVIGGSIYLTREPDRVIESSIQGDPVRKHVEECLDLVSLRGLELIGIYGGYTDGEGKDVLSYLNGNLESVYWLDESSLKAPKFSDIREEFERFIEKDMGECVNFGLFEDYEIIEGEVDVNVEFDEKVFVEVEWPLEIKKEDVEYKLNTFFSDYDLDMRKIYKLAYGIAETEKVYNFLEEKTLFLIDAYSGVDVSKLPPLAEYDFDCSVVRWPLISVEQKLKTVLKENIPYFKIEGTVFERKDGVVYDNFVLDIFREDFENVRVDFRYLDEFGLDLEINPSKGSYIEPVKNKFDVVLSMLCMNKYYFKYDVTYPVLVEISDDKALENGYKFRVPLMVVLKGNNPRYRQYSDVDVEVEDSLFCDEGQRSGELEVGVVNGKDGSRVNAEVYYSCIDEDCYIGETGMEESKLKLPICKGGVLSLSKEGYFTKSKRYDSLEGKKDSIGDLEIEPFRSKKVDIVKHVVEGEKLVSSSLGSKESVFISLEREADDVGGETYSTVINVPGVNEVELVPGVYNVKAMLIYNGDIVIPAEERCASRLPVVGCVKHYTLPEVKMESLIIGGSEYKWELGKELDLGELRFYVLSEGVPRTHGELEVLFDNIDKHNGLFKHEVIPQII